MKESFKTFFRQEWGLLLVLFIPLLASIVLYPSMPVKIPSHWNIAGEIDGYQGRFAGTFMIPLMNLGFYILFLVLPSIDPSRSNYQSFAKAYRLIRWLLHLFFAYIYAIITSVALGYKLDVSRLILLGVSVLFIVMGYALRNVKHNYFVGFRLPWTLASETNWDKTHLFGSKAMMLGGICSLAGSLLLTGTAQFFLFMVCVLGPAVITSLYSYLIFRQEHPSVS